MKAPMMTQLRNATVRHRVINTSSTISCWREVGEMSIGFPIIGRRRCVLENTAFHQFLFSIREKINGTPGINYGKLHSVLAAKRERGSGARTDEPIGNGCRQEKRGTCLAEEMEQGFVIPYRRKDKSYTTPVERAAGVINVVEQAAKSDETRRLRARGGIRLYETRTPFPRHMPRDAGMQISRRFPPPPFAL